MNPRGENILGWEHALMMSLGLTYQKGRYGSKDRYIILTKVKPFGTRYP
jgi:hypothetical protein